MVGITINKSLANDKDEKQNILMETIFDHLVTSNAQSGLRATREKRFNTEIVENTSMEEAILDLSQRSSTTIGRTNSNKQSVVIDNWNKNSTCHYTDQIHNDFNQLFMDNQDLKWNLEESLTDQFKSDRKKEISLLDIPNQSQMDLYSSQKKSKSSSRIILHELQPCLISSSFPPETFRWSKYFSLIGERSVSDEFFDHYLASIQSGLKIDMKMEYCHDIAGDFYWLTQIQFVAHNLIRLHYLGVPEEDVSKDFWTNLSDQRCHPIGWCKENSKSISPPPSIGVRKDVANEWEDTKQTPPVYLFDKDMGLTPVERLKVGMLLEIQDINRPWTLWFVRIIANRGGRLHLRYVRNSNAEEENSSRSSLDIRIFYLDRRVHPIGWTSNNTSNYSYDIPTCLTQPLDKQSLIDQCLMALNKQFLPPDLFKEQEEIVAHRFIEGMKIEVFQSEDQHIHIGRIGSIHNEYYFDVLIDNDDESEVAFVAHSTHPHILPPHWAAEHKLALMNGKGIRQSEDYWNFYADKNGMSSLASERCFHLITLNTTGSNQVEPGMKMEMISTLNGEDFVFSVTLIRVADHLMWLRVDDPRLFHQENLFYHVVPINSLNVFPVGWAKFNGFELITPIEYQMQIKTSEQDRYDLFSSVTHYPRIPRVYFSEVYFLTIYVNIRCYCGPHFCSSRLARIPAQFGPGPYRYVLIDMFHHLLSASSTNAHRALRRLDQQMTSEGIATMKTESIKAARKSSKLIRPISIPNEPRLVYQYLRHICTQLETCPNLISIKHFHQQCPDKCHILTNTFAYATHSKHKRPQLRLAQNRSRKQKSLLGHLKTPTNSSNVSSPVIEELPTNELSTDSQTTTTTTEMNSNDLSQPAPIPLPGSDRQTRGFRVHIEPKTHTITRTNRKQKLNNKIKQEPTEIRSNNNPSELPTRTEAKRSRIPKKKRSLSPSIDFPTPSVTSNILSSNKPQKKRRPIPVAQPPVDDFDSSPNLPIPKVEISSPPSALIRPIQYPIPPPIDPRNPVTWNVNDVCWYLNESGCSFALKTIKEQEIDGAALLLLSDLNTVQNLLAFKLGPAVKFFHVVEQLRTQVIDKFNSSPSLRTSSRLSTK